MTDVLLAPSGASTRLSPHSLRSSTLAVSPSGYFHHPYTTSTTTIPSPLPSPSSSSVSPSSTFQDLSYPANLSRLYLDSASDQGNRKCGSDFDLSQRDSLLSYKEGEDDEDDEDDEEDDDDSDDDAEENGNGKDSTSNIPPTSNLVSPAADDTLLEVEPSRHVDYLSHAWKEEDIWTSWRYVTARKHVYSNGVRLENASWRTWAKAKHKLGTISPETLNWYVCYCVLHSIPR